MNKICQTCLFWSSSILYERCFSWKDFLAHGICHKHSSIRKNNQALSVCESEGITGEFITKRTFSCNEYKFDSNYKQRRINEDWEQKEQDDKWEEQRKINIENELNRIRYGIKNNIHIRLGWVELPKGLNSITDLLTEEEKRQYREMEVQRRIKEHNKLQRKLNELE